jgi:hypothetical protein
MARPAPSRRPDDARAAAAEQRRTTLAERVARILATDWLASKRRTSAAPGPRPFKPARRDRADDAG